MATTLVNRADLRAAFFTLMNAAADDEALAEHYADASEAANRYLQQGIESAQFHVIEFVDPMRWIKRTAAITWLVDGTIGKYVALPADFLRLAGDDKTSALLDSTGQPWGRLLDGRERNLQTRTNAYYLRNDRLYLARHAVAPTNATLEYHHRHQVLDDDDEGQPGGVIDFPLADRWLIVAFAGYHAIHDSWPAGGEELKQNVRESLAHWKAELARRGRRSRTPRRLRGPRYLGPNLLLGRR